MKKLLFLFAILAMVGCGSNSDDDNLTTTNTQANQGSGIGTVNFTFKGKSYNYTNYNYRDGGLIATELIDESKPGMFWQNGTNSNSIAMHFRSGVINGQTYNENTINVFLYTNLTPQLPYSILVTKGNGTIIENTNCTNPKITYTTDSKNRISGTFTSLEFSGTFKDIVRIN